MRLCMPLRQVNRASQPAHHQHHTLSRNRRHRNRGKTHTSAPALHDGPGYMTPQPWRKTRAHKTSAPALHHGTGWTAPRPWQITHTHKQTNKRTKEGQGCGRVRLHRVSHAGCHRGHHNACQAVQQWLNSIALPADVVPPARARACVSRLQCHWACHTIHGP